MCVSCFGVRTKANLSYTLMYFLRLFDLGLSVHIKNDNYKDNNNSNSVHTNAQQCSVYYKHALQSSGTLNAQYQDL